MLGPAKWRGRIDRSLKQMKPKRDQAARFQRAYSGDYNVKPSSRSDLDENKDEMFVNFVFSFIETIAPTVFSGEPSIICKERNGRSKPNARMAQACTNYWFRELGLREQLMLCRWDAFFGPAAFLTEWDFQEELREVPLLDAPLDPFTGKPRIVKKMVITRDQPLAKRLDPWKVLRDTDSEPLNDRWRGQIIVVTKEEFDEMDVGSDLKKKVKGGAIPKDLQRLPLEGSGDDQGEDDEWVVIDKIYDLVNEKVLMLPRGEGVKDFIDVKDWPWFFEVENDRFPITILEGKPDASSPYTMSEFKAFWPQIQERNKLRTILQSHVRRNAPGWVGKKGVNDEDQIDKFLKSMIGEYTDLNDPTAIIAKPLPVLPKELFAFDSQVGDDLVNTSGFYEYSNDSIADTATEASLLSARGNIRKTERKQVFENFVARIGGKINQLDQQFMDQDREVEIADPQNPREMIFVSATPEQIQGEFAYSVKPGVMQQKDEGLERQQKLKFMELMAGNPHVDQRAMAEDACEVFNFDPNRILRPAKEVQAEQEAAAQANQPPPKEQKPTLQFSDIKWETLPPEIQAQVLHAAYAQNGIADDGSFNGQGVQGGPAPGAPGAGGGEGLPPDLGSIMPGAEMNQAPAPLPGAMPPPENPVQPASEMQGGNFGGMI